MQLKMLDINGFKSFPDRIQLQFDRGLTAVVGPNGSGKSNISDAVRWVLGEQSGKTLRSGRMEDVIFSGTQQRRAMGYASVSLTIDNADRELGVESDEVVINRKIYRSGESEYRINGSSVRLKDVNELFMDTGLGRDGYSIIGQGKIAEIVSAKSAQRREIFEEAAGISKYRYRREQAEKRLTQAQENLLRLRDILLELEGRVEPLRIQSQKAQEYLQIAQRRRSLEISLWMKTVERSREQLKSQEDKLILAQNDHDEQQNALEEIEETIRGVYEEIANCNMGVESARARIDDINSQAAEHNSKIAVWNNDILHNEETIARLTGDIAAHSSSRAELLEKIAAAQGEAGDKKAALEALEGQNGELRERLIALEHQNGETLRQQAALTQERAAVAHQIAAEQLKIATSSTMLDQLHENVQTIDLQKEQQETALADYQKQLTEFRELCESISEEMTAQQNMQKGYLIKHKSVGDRLSGLNQQHLDLLSRQKGYLQKARLIEDMERNMEGFLHSVKYIMNQMKSGNLRGIEGPVSQLIRVNSEHATAVEVALAGALQNIVVTTDTAAKVAIESLKNAKAGRATFLPMSVIVPRTLEEKGLESMEGFVAIADRLVQCDERYRNILRNLLGRIVVVEDLDCALPMAKKYSHRFKIVTLDGQVVNPGGSLTGGSLAQSAGLLSRAGEIERLKEKAQAAQGEIDTAAAAIKSAGEELSLLNAQLVGIDADMKTMSEDRIRYEGEQKRVAMAQEALLTQQREAERQREQIAARLALLQKESGSSEEALGKMSAIENELTEKLEKTAAAAAGHAQSLSRHAEERGELDMKRLAIQKDIEAIQSLAGQLGSQLESQQAGGELLLGQKAQLIKANDEVRRMIAEAQLEHAALKDRLEEYTSALQGFAKEKLALEGRATAERQRERELHQKGEELARELARLEERKIAISSEYDAVIARLYDEYELTLTAAQELCEPLEDVQEANRELSSLKAKIKALGSINVAAIEEYKEVSERYEFMKAQIEDVEKSREELYRLIGELTGEMKEIFTKSFHSINEHFGRIFVELFSGGNAKLLLTEPDNVLESGIEIYVQPPGKIIKNLAALSGGEQSFVAIAIYFAILKVRPSPFCLLDEIEAALDDVNVVKYASYLRRLTGKTQFIAITHRRGTMEEADVLYGVTMQEEGVSKLLRLGVSELESKLGMK